MPKQDLSIRKLVSDMGLETDLGDKVLETSRDIIESSEDIKIKYRNLINFGAFYIACRKMGVQGITVKDLADRLDVDYRKIRTLVNQLLQRLDITISPPLSPELIERKRSDRIDGIRECILKIVEQLVLPDYVKSTALNVLNTAREELEMMSHVGSTRQKGLAGAIIYLVTSLTDSRLRQTELANFLSLTLRQFSMYVMTIRKIYPGFRVYFKRKVGKRPVRVTEFPSTITFPPLREDDFCRTVVDLNSEVRQSLFSLREKMDISDESFIKIIDMSHSIAEAGIFDSQRVRSRSIPRRIAKLGGLLFLIDTEQDGEKLAKKLGVEYLDMLRVLNYYITYLPDYKHLRENIIDELNRYYDENPPHDRDINRMEYTPPRSILDELDSIHMKARE
ncbi:MAG: hypothetical protein RTU30_14730 [Candidatus Thorarchaeota archaeon]